MSEIIRYFGYGANRDPQMLAPLLGKVETELIGRPAVLEGFGLAIQTLGHIPDTISEVSELSTSPRTILERKWGGGFESYVIFRKQGGKVAGTIWDLTPAERERIRDWELVGDWYKDDRGTAIIKSGMPVEIVTESMGDGQHYDREVNGMEYEPWLQPSGLFEAVAISARREYDERKQSPA